MRIKRMGILLSKTGIRGITFAPIVILIKDSEFDNKVIRNHEAIHWYQQLEIYLVVLVMTFITQVVLLLNGIFEWWILLILIFPPVFYFIWYSVEWLIRIPINGKKAYMNLLFEREAHDNDDNLNYLNTRKHFAWL